MKCVFPIYDYLFLVWDFDYRITQNYVQRLQAVLVALSSIAINYGVLYACGVSLLAVLKVITKLVTKLWGNKWTQLTQILHYEIRI